jgi:hypothetical protein
MVEMREGLLAKDIGRGNGATGQNIHIHRTFRISLNNSRRDRDSKVYGV